MEAGTTTTLADALLDDLDDLSDFEEQGHEDQPNKVDEKEEQDTTTPNNEQQQQQPSDAAAAADLLGKRFLDDSGLQSHLQAIQASDDASNKSSQKDDQQQEDEKEYQLIVQSNKHLHRLSDELHKAHGALCTAYGPKFPELEDLLPNNPVQYKDAVAAIRNEMDLSRVVDLSNLLTPNQIITLSVAGSTTSGRPLDEMEMKRVDDIIAYMNEIVQIQTTLSNFVEQRMQGLAPNISALLGSTKVAARILGQAGGLAELVRIPSCNLQVLGQVKQSASSRAGLSTTTQAGSSTSTAASSRPHAGLLMECDLVQAAPRSLQAKVLKTVAAKLALAARCDYTNLQQGRRRQLSHQSTATATSGEQFRAQIQAKLTAWQEPDKAPVLKALPKPDLTVKKRRGGRKMRQLKARFEETALMKQANTRAFSAQAGEYGDDAMGLTMGLLDTAGVDTGNGVRKAGAGAEKRKARQTNTKASRKRAAIMARQAAAANNKNPMSSTASGMASTISFTPSQAMELVNPDAQAQKDRVRQANAKWFSDSAGFQSAVPPKK